MAHPSGHCPSSSLTSLDLLLPTRDGDIWSNQCQDGGTEDTHIHSGSHQSAQMSTVVDTQHNPQAVVFLPAHMAPPHSIPFFPTRPSKVFLSDISSPVLNRQILLSAFVHGYLPREAHTSPAVVLQSAHWTSPRSPAIKFAVETTGLLQLDAVKHDERIQLQGRKSRACMMECLHHEVRNCTVDAVVVLGAMVCAMVSEVSTRMSKGSRNASVRFGHSRLANQNVQTYAAVSSGSQAWALWTSDIVKLIDMRGLGLLSTDAGRYTVHSARVYGVESLLFLPS